MATAIQYDGTNQYSRLTTSILKAANDEYLINIRFKVDVTPDGNILPLLFKDGSNYLYYRVSNQWLLWRFGGQTALITGVDLSEVSTDFVEVEISKNFSGVHKIEFIPTGATATYNTATTFEFEYFALGFDYFKGQIEHIKHYSDVSKTTLLNSWSPEQSDKSNTGQQPVITDTIAGNNATGVNMPTDGSAWIDLGGGETIAADAGSYALTGADVSLLASYKLTAEPGTYTLTGADVDLVTGGPGETLTAGPGTYALTGADVDLKASRRTAADAGSYALTGAAVQFTAQRRTQVDAGSYALTGEVVDFFAKYVIVADAGTYTLTGAGVTLTHSGDTTQVISRITAKFKAVDTTVAFADAWTVKFKEE